MNSSIDRYAVIGSGIGHSRSPQIHAMFAAATRQPLEYGLLDTPPAAFLSVVRGFFRAGGRGLNVTVPHKQAALQLADRLTPRARRAGAVNTLAREGGAGSGYTLLGDNTDGAGLVRDLTDNLACRLHGARVLLLGAGGAARGVIAPLLEAGVAALDVHNRHAAPAARLAQEFADLGPIAALPAAGVTAAGAGSSMAAAGSSKAGAAAAASRASVAGGRVRPGDDAGYDLIVNATSASQRGALPWVPPHAVGTQTLAYDLAYGERDTVFVHWARSVGAARAVMGLGMLVEQAAESFLLWRGVRPETAAVLRALTTPEAASQPAP